MRQIDSLWAKTCSLQGEIESYKTKCLQKFRYDVSWKCMCNYNMLTRRYLEHLKFIVYGSIILGLKSNYLAQL
jgi:hypothetical protein